MNAIEDYITLAAIEAALKEKLPGAKAHRAMLPKGKSLSPPSDIKKIKQSAVLILLFEENGVVKFCLTKRNEGLKHHAGQISFPGGRCKKNETNTWETALRETEEEIDVPRKNIRIAGNLSELYISASNFNVHPFVGFYSGIPNFKPNRNEVDEVITLPLSSIFSNAGITVVSTSAGMQEVPCFKIDRWIVWGATAMMLEELKELITLHFQHRTIN